MSSLANFKPQVDFLIVLTNRTPTHHAILTPSQTVRVCSPAQLHSASPLKSKTTPPPPPLNLPQWPVAQKAKGPRLPSKAPTPRARQSQLLAVPMSSTLAVLLVRMGPLPPRPSRIPLQAAMMMATAATTTSH